MGYLHAKGILHRDLKSKNVFYDNGKVVITDFGLFSISGVLQAGRYSIIIFVYLFSKEFVYSFQNYGSHLQLFFLALSRNAVLYIL